MFCMSCGAQNADTAQFCAKCGKPLASSKPAAPAAVAPAPQQAAPVQSQQTYQQPNYGYAPQPAAYQPPARVEGCMGAAWKDITSSPNWLKRVITLCLVAVVPILNFAVDGYCLRWSRELSFGKREPLPGRIFRKREFATGFYAFLISFALNFAYGIVAVAAVCLVSGLFAMLNIFLGFVILVILLIAVGVFTIFFFNPAVDACVMRMAVTGTLEAGFNFKLVWDCFRRSMGSLIAASFLPQLIVGIVKGILVSILYAISMAIAGGAVNGLASGYGSRGMNPMYMMMSGSSIQGAISFISGAVLLGIFMLLLIYIVSAMFDMFGNLFTYRAVGHWAARTAPEWAEESDEHTLETLKEASAAPVNPMATPGVTDYSRPLQ